MREFSTPRVEDPRLVGTLTDVVLQNARDHPADVAFRVRQADGTWREVTTVAFRDDVVAAARGLLALGVEPGEPVGLLCSNRYEWTVLDYAIWWVGGVGVPLYTTAQPEQTQAVLRDSGALTVLVETSAHRALVEEVPTVWVLDEAGWDDLADRGRDVEDDDLESRRTQVTGDWLASLVYTSGTTGEPRGCMLTHANFLAETVAALHVLEEVFAPGDAATLMVLPLPHVFARAVQVAAVTARVTLGHTRQVRDLPRDLHEFAPTFLLAVPRIFESLYTTASQQATVEGRGDRFSRAAATAIAYSRAVESGRVGPLLRARHALDARRVHPEVRALLGGRCRYGVCGGAPLGDRLSHFYRGIDLPVVEGYGLTETTAAVTLAPPSQAPVGSVGPPLPGTGVRVSEEGELWVRGAQVSQGHWPDARTGRPDDDGWLATGDLGEIDDQGFVSITGRRQEVLVTAGGKHVNPEPIEERIRAHRLVEQCLVLGDSRPFLAALVTLDPVEIRAWAAAHGVEEDTLAGSAALAADLQAALDAANAQVSPAESVRRFLVLDRAWSEERGELTASLKLRRRTIVAGLREEIDRLFAT